MELTPGSCSDNVTRAQRKHLELCKILQLLDERFVSSARLILAPKGQNHCLVKLVPSVQPLKLANETCRELSAALSAAPVGHTTAGAVQEVSPVLI